MKGTKNKIYIAAGLFAATLIAIIICSVAMVGDYDVYSGYYAHGAVLPTVFNTICIISVLAVIGVSIFLLPKGEKIPPMRDKLCRLLAIPPVAALLYISLERFGALSQTMIYGGFGKELLSPFFSALLPVLCAIFFISICAGFKKNAITALSGVLTIFFMLFEIYKSYTDMTVAMNTPVKVLFYFAALSTALFILAEMRIIWGDTAHSKTSHMSQYLAVLLTGVYSIPLAVFVLSRQGTLSASCLFFLSIFVLSCARVITVALAKDTPAEEVEVEAVETEEITEETIEITEETEEAPTDENI